MGISSIGQTIAELRKQKGSTQEELASAAGVSAQAVSKWENGGAPDAELLPAIADFLGVTVDRLFGRSVSGNIVDSVRDYVAEPGQFNGFDRALDIYLALHNGLSASHQNFDGYEVFASHNSNENGYSLYVTNGYGNVVKRKFWESVNLDTLAFARKLFALLAEPGALEVLFALLRRSYSGPANFEMIKTALENANCPEERLHAALEKLEERGAVYTKDSPYEEIGKTYYIHENWYLGISAVICASQALKISLPGISCFLGYGAWPIDLRWGRAASDQ